MKNAAIAAMMVLVAMSADGRVYFRVAREEAVYCRDAMTGNPKN